MARNIICIHVVRLAGLLAELCSDGYIKEDEMDRLLRRNR
jgi:hypothetical protein